MRFKVLSAGLVTAALLPLSAQAEGLSYSYADAAYINTDVDGFSKDIDGFLLRGSFELTEQVFMFAGYSDQSTTVFGSDIDFQSYNLGVGYAWPIAESADVYGKLSYVSAEVDVPGASFDDDGYGLGVGLRGRLAEQFELEGSVNYIDLSDSGDDTSVGLGARWYFTEQFAVGIEGEFGDDGDTYGIGVRWDFGG